MEQKSSSTAMACIGATKIRISNKIKPSSKDQINDGLLFYLDSL